MALSMKLCSFSFLLQLGVYILKIFLPLASKLFALIALMVGYISNVK